MKKKILFISLLAMVGVVSCTKYNGQPPEEAEHEHTFAEVYSSNETQHWYAATCEHTDQKRGLADHAFGEFIISQEATVTTDGKQVRTCSICGYKNEVTIPKIGDNDNPSTEQQWSITAINTDRSELSFTVGDNPISITPTLVGEGTFPTSMSVSCPDQIIETVVEEETTSENVKVANISANVVESGTAFVVTPVNAGTTKITITSTGNTEIKKEINVTVNPKIETHNVTLDNETLTINKGSQNVLLCTSTDEVTWTTSDATIIELENKTNSGVWIKGKKTSSEPVEVNATICAGTANETSATCLVTVTANVQTTFNYYYINNQNLTDLKVYLWNSNGSNTAWPGASLGNRFFINKDLFDVYKITIDTEEAAYEHMIISGNDASGFVQTVDIDISSFKVQNAFSIPSLPTDVVDGARKASVSLCTINPVTDRQDDHYVQLSTSDVEIYCDRTANVICYTSENTVEYTATSGAENIEISNKTKNGFTVKGINKGSAVITASIQIGEETKTTTLNVTVKEDNKVAYYFANNYAWTSLYVYFWNAKGSNGTFPGEQITATPVKNADNVNTYEFSFYKYYDAWTNCIISGTDGTHGWSKTDDIVLADLNNASKNMITITETSWDRQDEPTSGNFVKKCSYSTGVFAEFAPSVSLSESTKTVKVGNTFEITVTANTTFEVVNNNDTLIDLTIVNNKITVEGLAIGSASFDVYVDKGGTKEVKVTCNVTVEAAPVTYDYTITGLEDWYSNNDPRIEVWAWGGDAGAGIWIDGSISGSTITFTSEHNNISGCKILRINPSYTGEPSFSLEANTQLWNESGDISVSSMTGIYQ